MQSAETVLGVILTTGERYALKSARTVREGAEKDPNHGHLAGGLLHSEGGRAQ